MFQSLQLEAIGHEVSVMYWSYFVMHLPRDALQIFIYQFEGPVFLRLLLIGSKHANRR